MMIFDNEKFAGYLVNVKAELSQMILYRANFYCALCDVHQ